MPESLYCPIPWLSAAIKSNGDYRVCCQANFGGQTGLLENSEGSPLNMAHVSADEIRNHSLLKEIRATFLKNAWPSTCGRCQGEEGKGLRSARVHAITRLEEAEKETETQRKIYSETESDGSINPAKFPIQELDIRFGNKCNLRCRSCSPLNSSAWYSDFYKLGNLSFSEDEERVELFEDPNGRIQSNYAKYDWYKNLDLEKKIPANLEDLSWIYFIGGEPFLIEEHIQLLELLVSRGVSKNIYLEYNTNLTLMPKKLLELWPNFKKVGLGISIDGVGAFHEYLRFPGKFATIEKNLREVDNLAIPLRGWFTTTVSLLNISHLPELILWKCGQGYKKIFNGPQRPPISCHLLYQPAHLNLRNLPNSAKNLVELRLAEGMKRLRSESGLVLSQLEATQAMFDGFLRQMRLDGDSIPWVDHWQESKKLDLFRGHNFAALDPELAELLEREI